MSRLDASLLDTTSFRIGITDDRGDGRPDFSYHAHVLYADTVTPVRLSLRGGTPVIIQGLGFSSGLSASIGGAAAQVLAVSANRIILKSPAPAQDGLQSITLTEAATAVSSIMTDVLTFGTAATNNIVLISGGGNPAVPVGGETPVPIVIRVTSSDGFPVSGATVALNTTSGILSACGTFACTVGTDDSGQVSTRLTVATVGSATVTATLAPASYSNPNKVQATVVGTASSADITPSFQYRWLAYGATVDLPLTVRVISSGSPLSGKIVTFQVQKGASFASLSSGNAMTDPNGDAVASLHVTNLSGDAQVSACVSPANAPCQTFYLSTVALSALKLVAVGGNGQMVPVGQPFLPFVVRVTDSASPPHAVQAAKVTFQSTILRPDQDAPTETTGESSSRNHGMPVILGSSQAQMISDLNGLASLVPSAGGLSGALEIEVAVSAGTNAAQQFEVETLWPVATAGGSGTSGLAPVSMRPPTGAVILQNHAWSAHSGSAKDRWIYASQSAIASRPSVCGDNDNNSPSDEQETAESRSLAADCAEAQP